jgi:hypothetical protein
MRRILNDAINSENERENISMDISKKITSNFFLHSVMKNSHREISKAVAKELVQCFFPG